MTASPVVALNRAVAVAKVYGPAAGLDALDRDFDLPWLHVLKQVDGRAAVQLERLYHQIAWQLETTFLEVPRTGPHGRFFPIKEPEDLERARAGLRELLSRTVLDR